MWAHDRFGVTHVRRRAIDWSIIKLDTRRPPLTLPFSASQNVLFVRASQPIVQCVTILLNAREYGRMSTSPRGLWPRWSSTKSAVTWWRFGIVSLAAAPPAHTEQAQTTAAAITCRPPGLIPSD